MNIINNPCKTILVEFTRQEGNWLVIFFEERIKSSNSQDYAKPLDEVLAKLCDADTVALWLRENIVVNLTHEEAVQTLKILKAGMDYSASSSVSLLASIVSKLECVV